MANVFERHPRLTVFFIILFFISIFLVAAELLLKHYTGLGNPVLFYKHPSFGYRLKPDQETYRFSGAHFRINNLGLRANENWDRDVNNKILFLGDSVTYGGNNISNEDLFSQVAVMRHPHLKSGNAGIPNWGVENVHGLIVNDKFLPASVYVSMFIEHDFYRGLMSGENKPWILYERPGSALEELTRWLWYRYIRNPRDDNKRETEATPRAVRLQRAVSKLKEMDEFLKSRGYQHLIFISPTMKQITNMEKKDAIILDLLKEQQLDVVYLVDRLQLLNVSEREKESWYQDDVHLSTTGHRIWADIIEQELSARKLFRGP